MDCMSTASWKETAPHRVFQALPTHVTACGRGTLEQMQARRAGSLANTMCNTPNLCWTAMQQWRTGAMGSTKSGAPPHIHYHSVVAVRQAGKGSATCYGQFRRVLLDPNKHLRFPHVDCDAGVCKAQQQHCNHLWHRGMLHQGGYTPPGKWFLRRAQKSTVFLN